MASLVGRPMAVVGNTTDIHSSALNPVGTRACDAAGNEYIYLKGVASCVAGSIVTYNTSFQSALSVTGVRAPVAVAMAAITASSWGWFCVYGAVNADFAGAATAGAKLYSASTGKCDDAVVSGDQIDGAFVGATVSAAGQGSVLLSYPRMNGLG